MTNRNPLTSDDADARALARRLFAPDPTPDDTPDHESELDTDEVETREFARALLGPGGAA